MQKKPNKGVDNQKNPQKIKMIKNMKKKKPAGFFNNLFSTILIIFTIIILYSVISENQTKPEKITIADLVNGIRAGEVSAISVKRDLVTTTFVKDEIEIIKEFNKESQSSLVETLISYGLTSEELLGLNIKTESDAQGFGYWALMIGPILLPLFFIIFLFWYLSRSVKGAGMQAFSFGQSNARMMNPTDKKRVTFKDVAGCEEAKQELMEIVDFLKNPKKFIDIGAQIPKGILMMGAPGTGKTLLARATAGEAGVNFFSISGSEFVEMFVGVGASRVRDLFKVAKTAAPSIIFIDEIDAVGRARGVGTGGGNDEREQTLNQILVEMDGFEPNDKVIVMAATNRPDVLDPAILRPGRFDRRVTIDLPDRKDREAILQVQAVNKPLAEDVDFKLIAERTPGFSGADIYSLVNEAAILAARENRNKVSQFDLIRSIEKVILGPERKNHLLTKKEKEITAYHEVGHALVASLLPNSDPVHKISIIARGRAGGYTLKLPSEDRKLQTRKEFIDDLAMTLGGYVTEKMIFGDVTTGPSNDLQVATSLARDMVTRFGMSEKFGPIAFEGSGRRAMFGGDMNDKTISDKYEEEIDNEVRKLLEEARETAENLLSENKRLLEIISKRLIEVETLERKEYENLLAANGVFIKKTDSIEKQIIAEDLTQK
jgi:cell division protease FtsH